MNKVTVLKAYPRRGVIYTLRDILEKLQLDDSPFLYCDGGVIQTSHVTNEQLLSVPGMAETRWEYLRTTSEWIPLFLSVDSSGTVPVDVEPNTDPDAKPGSLWITPRGFPRKQYVWGNMSC